MGELGEPVLANYERKQTGRKMFECVSVLSHQLESSVAHQFVHHRRPP